MDKRKRYSRVRLVAEALREIHQHFDDLKSASQKADIVHVFTVESLGREEWTYDNFDEFIAEYPKARNARYYRVTGEGTRIDLYLDEDSTVVNLTARTREAIQKISNIVERFSERSLLPPEPPPQPTPKARPVIFVGHGHSAQWRDLKDHLHEKHNYQVEAYEIGARAGHTIRDILEEMLTKSSFALLVLTGEDETTDGRLLARQNVVHETGLFQGRLGFSRAIVLLEQGAEEFSNVAGIQQMRFSKGNIKEVFGEVLAVLRREFGE